MIGPFVEIAVFPVSFIGQSAGGSGMFAQRLGTPRLNTHFTLPDTFQRAVPVGDRFWYPTAAVISLWLGMSKLRQAPFCVKPW